MSIAQRRIDILQYIKQHKQCNVKELTKHFQVSSMTIRRDLQLFENQGLIYQTHGSVFINEAMKEESFQEKLHHKLDVKETIAKKAAALVNDGDTIIIDCGSTTLQMLKYLQNKKITIFTNSYPVVQYVSGLSNITLYMAPGKYSEVSSGFFGAMTIHFFSQIQADKVFMGTYGFDGKIGASVPNMDDAQTKIALLNAGNKKFLLVDQSKKKTNYTGVFAKLDAFDSIITD